MCRAFCASSCQSLASACYNLGAAWQVGAEATVNEGVRTRESAVAAQTKIDDVVAAVILADKMETVKVSDVGQAGRGNLRRRRGGVQAEGGNGSSAPAPPPSATTGTAPARS